MTASAARGGARGLVHLVTDVGQIRDLERRSLDALPAWLAAWSRSRASAGQAAVALLRRGLFARPPRREEVRAVTALTVGNLGDHVVLLTTLAALRLGYPAARLTLLACTDVDGRRAVDELLGDGRLVDETVFAGDPPTARRGLRVQFDPALHCVASCDLFVNLSPFGNRGLANAVVRELLVARKVGAKAVAGFGLRGWPGRRLHRRLLHTYVGNEPRRGTEVLAELGLEAAGPDAALPLAGEARDAVRRRLLAAGVAGRVAVIHPGAKFPAQRWPADRFAAVARALRSYGFAVAVSGVAAERDIGERVLSGLAGPALNLAGATSVRELVELLRMSELCVTNDTGAMHLAALLGRPTVALFSTRQSPAHWFPYGQSVVALLSFGGGRYDYDDHARPHASLLSITPTDVLAAAVGVLGGQTPSAARPGGAA